MERISSVHALSLRNVEKRCLEGGDDPEANCNALFLLPPAFHLLRRVRQAPNSVEKNKGAATRNAGAGSTLLWALLDDDDCVDMQFDDEEVDFNDVSAAPKRHSLHEHSATCSSCARNLMQRMHSWRTWCIESDSLSS